jgi:hypothetical protein
MLEQGYPAAPRLTRRRLFRRALCVAACSLAPQGRAQQVCTEPLPALQPAGQGRWWLPASNREPDADNGGLTAQLVAVREGDRLWLVGSGPTPAFGARLACALRAATGLAVTDIVHTRAAPELAMGNAAFPQARLWALPEVLVAMRARCEECQSRLKGQIGAAGDSLQPGSIRPPTLAIAAPGVGSGQLGPFEWRAVARAPGDRVLVLRHGPSMPPVSTDDPGLVIAQGLVWAQDVPDLHGLQSETLQDTWMALQGWVGTARLLGEQGGLSDAKALAEHVAYLTALRSAIAPFLAQGDLWGAVGQGVALPAYRDCPRYDSRHPLNVQRLWLELEPTLFR